MFYKQAFKKIHNFQFLPCKIFVDQEFLCFTSSREVAWSIWKLGSSMVLTTVDSPILLNGKAPTSFSSSPSSASSASWNSSHQLGWRLPLHPSSLGWLQQLLRLLTLPCLGGGLLLLLDVVGVLPGNPPAFSPNSSPPCSSKTSPENDPPIVLLCQG